MNRPRRTTRQYRSGYRLGYTLAPYITILLFAAIVGAVGATIYTALGGR